MDRVQTFILVLVVVVAAFAGGVAADSTTQIESIGAADNGMNGVDEENGDEENGDEENETDDPPTPAELQIGDVETNTPITVGETIDVTVTVENVGEESGAGEVWFDLDEFRKDEAEVSLDGGESTTVSLSYVSKSGDADDWSLTVGTPDDTSTRTVTIEERSDDEDEDDESSSGGSGSGSGSGFTGSASFDLQSFTAPESATVGDVVELNATIENTGTVSEEKLVWFAVDGSTVNETEVDLARGDEHTVTYEYNTTGLENGTYEVTAETPDGVETREIVLEPKRSELVIDEVSANTPVMAGDLLEATVELRNVGNATANDEVTLLLDEYRIDATRVSIAPGESTSVRLTYRTNEDLTGDLAFTVDAVNTTEPFSATVSEPTPTPTDTPTDTPTTTSETELTETVTSTPENAASTNGSVPGFGVTAVVVAIVISLLAAMANTRRY